MLPVAVSLLLRVVVRFKGWMRRPGEFYASKLALKSSASTAVAYAGLVASLSPSLLASNNQPMAPVPTHSPVTGQACAPSYIHADSAHFRDQTGRTLLLRGVNLAASAKTPRGQPSHKLAGFWEHARSGEMSFVGRVLELEDADVHLERLREWGFTTLRYVTTWESIEHAGPCVSRASHGLASLH